MRGIFDELVRPREAGKPRAHSPREGGTYWRAMVAPASNIKDSGHHGLGPFLLWLRVGCSFLHDNQGRLAGPPPPVPERTHKFFNTQSIRDHNALRQSSSLCFSGPKKGSIDEI